MAGGIGLSSAVAYALLSAPDLAMTQIAVEVVTTLLLFLALSYLPQRTPLPSPPQRWVAAAFSLAAGIATALLTYWLLLTPRQSISHYFLAQSLPAGGGANIVNVILVDFRGYDTMGEITVLGIAALGGWALLANWYASARQPFPLPLVESRPMLLRQAVPLVLPLSLVVSIYIFLRGHNLPGGGFIAGLITAAALLLLYLAHGLAAANTLLHAHDGWRFARTIAAGLGVAVLTGIGAMLLGYPFLTSAHGEPHLPLIGT
ncbi:MAG: DUF4040 domain-containing protein, partial [Geminicoccaceae bacterium]|nr:DUF4040 domain-containing protein [Geminicoccaceae bacterium]